LSLYEVNEASTLITEAAHEDAEIIFGAVIDENMGENVRVTVIATGFNQNLMNNPAIRPASHEQMQIMQQQMQVARQAINHEQRQVTYQQPPMPQQTYTQPLPPTPQQTYQQPVTTEVAPTMAADLPPIPAQPATTETRIETPVVPPVTESAVTAPVIETPVVETAPVMPAQEQAFMPPPPAQPMVEDQKPLPRDILMAKARAYKEQTAHQARQTTPEQLSMEVENEEREESLDMPLNQNDLEVPTYLRRQQSKQEDVDV